MKNYLIDDINHIFKLSIWTEQQLYYCDICTKLKHISKCNVFYTQLGICIKDFKQEGIKIGNDY